MRPEALVNKFRADHKDELDKTLEVLIDIRDGFADPGKTIKYAPKDRIDAARSIARMLGGMVPEQAEKEKTTPKKPEIKSRIEEELERLLEKL